MKKTIAVIAIALLAGCASYPPPTQAQEPAPVPKVEPQVSEKILQLQLQYVRGEMAKRQLEFPKFQKQEQDLLRQLQSIQKKEGEK